MGARQSKRSVDITTTPKKEGAEEQQQPLDGRLGHIEEGGSDKPAANGAPTLSTTDIQVRKRNNLEDGVTFRRKSTVMKLEDNVKKCISCARE